MNLDEFKSVLSNSRLDVWGIIDAAINLASTDFADELKHRRDGIVERLYARNKCSNCDVNVITELKPNGVVRSVRNNCGEAGGESPLTSQSIPQDNEEDEEDLDPYGGLFDDEQSKILRIKEQLEDQHQV